MEIFVMILIGVVFLAACIFVITGGRKNSKTSQPVDDSSENKKSKMARIKKKNDKADVGSKTAEDIVFTKSDRDDNQSNTSEKTELSDFQASDKNEPVAVAASIADFNDDSVIYDVMAQMADFGHIYNQNLFLPTKDGDIHLLNHVSLAPTGFYLFTFLNVGKTYIIGTEDSKWWTRFRSPENKDYMDNPVLAVDEEVKLLKTFFPKTADSDYHTYIVLNNSCEIRDIELRENGNVRVLNADALKDVLIRDTGEHDQVFDQGAMTQMQKVIDVLKSDENLTERLAALKNDMRAEKADDEKNNESEATSDDRINDETTKNPEEEKSFDSVEVIESEETPESEEKSLPEDPPEGKFTPSELNLRNSLFVWRGQEMSVNATDDQLLIDDDLIDAIVERKPKTVEELYEIDGLSEAIIKRYGQAIVNMTSHTP